MTEMLPALPGPFPKVALYATTSHVAGTVPRLGVVAAELFPEADELGAPAGGDTLATAVGVGAITAADAPLLAAPTAAEVLGAIVGTTLGAELTGDFTAAAFRLARLRACDKMLDASRRALTAADRTIDPADRRAALTIAVACA